MKVYHPTIESVALGTYSTCQNVDLANLRDEQLVVAARMVEEHWGAEALQYANAVARFDRTGSGTCEAYAANRGLLYCDCGAEGAIPHELAAHVVPAKIGCANWEAIGHEDGWVCVR
jgi:hypothetical protein